MTATVDYRFLAKMYEWAAADLERSPVWLRYQESCRTLMRVYLTLITDKAAVSFGPGVYRTFIHGDALAKAEKKFQRWSDISAMLPDQSVQLEQLADFEKAYLAMMQNPAIQRARAIKKAFKDAMLQYFAADRTNSPYYLDALDGLEQSTTKAFRWYENKIRAELYR